MIFGYQRCIKFKELAMLTKRIIPCLDIKDGRTVKGINFENIRDAGDPVEIAKRYDHQGADELTFLDITASSDNRGLILHIIEEVGEKRIMLKFAKLQVL